MYITYVLLNFRKILISCRFSENIQRNFLSHHASSIQSYGWNNPTNIQSRIAVYNYIFDNFIHNVLVIKYLPLYFLCNSTRKRKWDVLIFFISKLIDMVFNVLRNQTILISYLVNYYLLTLVTKQIDEIKLNN